jgi:hypothetical protein
MKQQRHQESDGATSQVALACDVSAVPPEQRDRWVAIGRQVYAAVEEVRELADGYRFRLPTSSTVLLQVAEYVSNERLCCGFLRFQVEVEPARGPVWLQLTGPEGAKDYMRTVFAASRLLDEGVARTAGLA